MTSHEPSTEHDLSGLRDHFNPRARWKAAIAGARALHRFGSHGSRTSTSSKSSGGWHTMAAESDDDDDNDEEDASLDPESVPGGAPGQTELPNNIKVHPPEDTPRPKKSPLPDVHAEDYIFAPECKPSPDPSPKLDAAPAPSEKSGAHELKHESSAHEPLQQKVPQELFDVRKEGQRSSGRAHNGHARGHSAGGESDEEYLNMPGSFLIDANGHDAHGQHHGLWNLLRKMRLKSD